MTLENPIINESKRMVTVDLRDHKEILEQVLALDGTAYTILPEVYDEIIKNSGISKSNSRILKAKCKDTWNSVIINLYDYYYEGKINLLIVDDVVSAVYLSKFAPILNHDFINTVFSVLSDYSDFEVSNYFYDKDSRVARVTISALDKPTDIQLDVVLQNDETDCVTCMKRVVKEGVTFYLPYKYYRVNSRKYNKVSTNSKDALNMMLLQVIEDMSSDYWYKVTSEINMQFNLCKKIPATYEEYRYAERLTKRVAASSDMTGEEIKEIVSNLFSDFEDFEVNYPELDEAKRSYIWRCSALSDNKVFSLINSLNNLSDRYGLYPECREELLHAIGDYLMLDKIYTTLAKKRRGEDECQQV